MRLAQAQRTLEGMLERGAAFAEAEDWINALSLPADHLAALWLLAWSNQSPDDQRRLAHCTLAMVSGTPSPGVRDRIQEVLHRVAS